MRLLFWYAAMLALGCAEAREDVASMRLGDDAGSGTTGGPQEGTEPGGAVCPEPVACPTVEVECTPTPPKQCPACEECSAPSEPEGCPQVPAREATECPACAECPVAPAATVEAGAPTVVVVHEFHGDACADCANDPAVSCYPSLATDESPDGGCWRATDLRPDCQRATFVSEDLLEYGRVAVLHVPSSRDEFYKCDDAALVPEECVCSELLCVCP